MSAFDPFRFVGRTAAFAAWTAGVVNSHRVLSRFDDDLPTPQGKQAFIDVWAKGMFPLMGVKLTVVRGERPRELGPFLVVLNHRSPLDILVAVHLVGGVVLAHHGVEQIPVVGDAARVTDTIFVDREDGKSGARAIRQMRRRLRERRNVIVFPEGTTFRGDEVRPFKRGAFSAARGLDEARVLPIGLAYQPGDEYVGETFGQHMRRMAARKRTCVWAAIGEPMPTPKTAADEETIRLAVQALVDDAAQARDADR